jgi:DNA-binding Lrp family transcriptional regulator
MIVLSNDELGYEKECLLTIKQIEKTIEDDDLLNRSNLFGEVEIFAKQLGGARVISLATRSGAEDKVGLLVELFRPAIVECNFIEYKTASMRINTTDLKIIRCLLSDARMRLTDIANQTSTSTKTVSNRIKKMRENHILIDFTVILNISSLSLVGYLEFVILIKIQKRLYDYIFRLIHHELQEYLMFVSNSNQIFISQKSEIETIFAVFFSSNIASIDLVITKIGSYEGVVDTELFITTKLTSYHEWVKMAIDKKMKSLRTQKNQYK